MSLPSAEEPNRAAAAWGVACALADRIGLSEDATVGRDAFAEVLWAVWGERGLVAIDEGAIDVTEARALGLVTQALVVDAAAAPVDRDWVGSRADGTLTGWFAAEPQARAAAEWLAGLDGCHVLGLQPAPVAAVQGWQATFQRIDVPGFGAILPAWEPGIAGPGPEGATVFIEPGAGFGTGLHATTQLCLEALATWRSAGGRLERVLDFGSGSGILGIAAAVLGADRVDAVEVDRRVHEAIRTNAERNGVAERVLVHETLPAAAEGYDLVLANIVADVLVDHAEPLTRRLRHLAPRGEGRRETGRACGGLVLSGLLADEVPRIRDVYGRLMAAPPQVSTRDGWCCLRFGGVWDA